MAERLAILTSGLLDDSHAKTAHGVLRYGERDVVAVVDRRFAGRTAREVRPYCRRDTPIVADAAEARRLGATVALVGTSPVGGSISPQLRAEIIAAIAVGLHVEAGLHDPLTGDREIVAAARAAGVELRDLRTAPTEPTVPSPQWDPEPGVFVVHTVGSDAGAGKMSATLELHTAAKQRGEASVFVATGQTGIAISGWGVAVDHVVSDFVAGAACDLVTRGQEDGDLLWIEGQGSLFHPAYSGVTLGLLHGSRPDALILVHRAGATTIEDYPRNPIPPLETLVRAYEQITGPIKPARVVAIALNTGALEESQALEAIAQARELTGVESDDPIRFGPERLLECVMSARDLRS